MKINDYTERWVFNPSHVSGNVLLGEKGYNGTIVNCNVNNNNFYFPTSTKSYIDTTLSKNLSGSGDFTVSVVCKYSFTERNSYIIGQTHTSSPYSSDWFILYQSSLGWFRSVVVGNSLLYADNKIHVVTMVWEKSIQRYKMYVDNDYIGQSSTVTGYSGVNSIKIGVRPDSTADGFIGNIYEAIIYERALTADEIKKLHSNLFSKYPADGINHLVGYYDLSKIDDNVIKDLSKTQNNGIIDYTYCRKGEKGLIFHSGGNLKAGLTLPFVNDYNFDSSFTFGCWIYKTSESNPYPRLFYKSRTGASNGDVANSSYFFGFNGTSAPNNNLLRFAISSSSGTTDIVSDYAVTLNTWEFVLVTADMLNSIAKIYANGLQVYSGVIPSSVEYADYPILIGGSSSSWHFIGEIGECFIFNESLTADEVKKLYITTKNRYL